MGQIDTVALIDSRSHILFRVLDFLSFVSGAVECGDNGFLDDVFDLRFVATSSVQLSQAAILGGAECLQKYWWLVIG